MNIDAKLLKLAEEYKSRASSNTKANRARRAFVRGQAGSLILKHYPLNYDAIQAEWNRLAQ